MAKPTDAELLYMMELSGYDASLVHPACYRTFSYKDFSRRLIEYVLAKPLKT